MKESLGLGCGVDSPGFNRLMIKGGTKSGRSRSSERIRLLSQSGKWIRRGKPSANRLEWQLRKHIQSQKSKDRR